MQENVSSFEVPHVQQLVHLSLSSSVFILAFLCSGENLLWDCIIHYRRLLRFFLELAFKHSCVSVVKEVVQVVLLFRELLGDDPCNACDRGVVMRLTCLELPERRVDRVCELRIGLIGVEWVITQIMFELCVRRVWVSVDHESRSWVLFEKVVDEGDNGHDGGGRSKEAES